jgi:hypothetical protein
MPYDRVSPPGASHGTNDCLGEPPDVGPLRALARPTTCCYSTGTGKPSTTVPIRL